MIRQAVGIREACILLGPWHPSHRELCIGGSDGVQVLDILISPERIDIGLVYVLNSRSGERFRRDTFDGQIDAKLLLRVEVSGDETILGWLRGGRFYPIPRIFHGNAQGITTGGAYRLKRSGIG